MPNIAKRALTSAKSQAAAFASSIKKALQLPTIPAFFENFKSLISIKVIKDAIKKKVDAVADILDPTNPFKQLKGDKKTGIIASVIPSQVKDLVKAAKEGSKLTPKEALTGTLEKFTGVNLDQDNLLQSLGGAVLDNINTQIDALRQTVVQTVIGCINKAVRDLLNKFPTLDFLINLEERLNSILGKFRNQLEQKIDAELRGLLYNKIKIHQLTLFKQSLHSSIRDICPEATPASSAEVKTFMDAFEEGKRKREEANKVKDTTNQVDDQSDIKSPEIGEQGYRDPPSEKKVKDYVENPGALAKDVESSAGALTDTMKKVAKSQKQISPNTVSSIVRRRSRLKGGARLMQMSKFYSKQSRAQAEQTPETSPVGNYGGNI